MTKKLLSVLLALIPLSAYGYQETYTDYGNNVIYDSYGYPVLDCYGGSKDRYCVENYWVKKIKERKQKEKWEDEYEDEYDD